MRVKIILLISAGLVTLWLLCGGTTQPRLAEVFGNSLAPEPEKLGKARSNLSKLEARAAIRTPDGFIKWQQDTRQAYVKALGVKHIKPTLQPVVEIMRRQRVARGITREYFRLIAEDGMRIPGVMQYPSAERKLPAILVVPGHSASGESGLSQLIDESESYQHAAATRLAEAGYFTIAIELRGFGLLGKPEHPDHKTVAYNEIKNGSSYKGAVLRDLQQVLDYLYAREDVEPMRIGVTGASLGGEIAVALAAIRPKIKAIAFSAYIEAGPFADFDGGLKKQPHYCHLVPGLGEFMHREDIYRLLAPRPTIGLRDLDTGERFKELRTELSAAWGYFPDGKRFNYVLVRDGLHEFFVDDTIRFFDDNL